MMIQPTGLNSSSGVTLPSRSAGQATSPETPLPQDEALLAGSPAPAEKPRASVTAPVIQAPEPPPAVLTAVVEEPGWRGELLELKGRMDYLSGLQTHQCGQWWHETVKSLPGPANQLAQELANQTLTEARLQDPGATIGQVAFPVGSGVHGLMLAALQTEQEARLAPQADRTELLKQNLFVTAITGPMISRLSPPEVEAAQGEAGGQATRFAEALASRLAPDDLQACQVQAAESPLFRLSLHEALPEMAASLSDNALHYQSALGETNRYLGGLSQVQAQQTAVAAEVQQFFQAHPEALG